MNNPGAKVTIAAIVLAMCIVPIRSEAFSLDVVIQQYLSYLRQQIADLKAENAELRAELAKKNVNTSNQLGAVSNGIKTADIPKTTADVTLETISKDNEGYNVEFRVSGSFDDAGIKMWDKDNNLLIGMGFQKHPNQIVVPLNAMKPGTFTYEILLKQGSIQTMKNGSVQLVES